jgi:hypothetical protein
MFGATLMDSATPGTAQLAEIAACVDRLAALSVLPGETVDDLRHAARIDTLVEELFRFASDLFAIPFAGQSTAASHRVQSRFQCKFWSEPPSLRPVGNSLVFAPPRALARRLVLDRGQRFALESVEAQAGRMHYSQPLEKVLAEFGHEVTHKIEDAIEGIATAVDKARKLRSAGHAASAERIEALSATVHALDEIDESIARVAAARHA